MKSYIYILFLTLAVAPIKLSCMNRGAGDSKKCPVPDFVLKDPKIYDKATQDYLKSKGCTPKDIKRKK